MYSLRNILLRREDVAPIVEELQEAVAADLDPAHCFEVSATIW